MGVTIFYRYRCIDMILENCTITFVIPGTYLTKDQHPPNYLVVYSTQYGAVP